MALSVLDLYILSMLDRGCETPYDLHRNANLSLGAISPSMSRLLREKLVTRADEVNATRRPRHRYALTAKGKIGARTGWKQFLRSSEVPSDMDSLLRLADIATYNNAPVSQIVTILQAAGRQKLVKAEQLNASLSTCIPGSYLHLKHRTDIARFNAEGKILVRIAEEVGANSVHRQASKDKRSH